MNSGASIAAAVLALVVGVGCSSGAEPKPSPGVSDTTRTTAAADPYDVYLRNNPDPALILSREDAQTRAYLGCGTTWAPGTVDAALHDAYQQLCK